MKKALSILVAGIALVASQAGHSEGYKAGQMGMYVKLCSADASGSLCMMYLAGYRAGLYEQRDKTLEVEAMKSKYCSANTSPGLVQMCKSPSAKISMGMIDGCNNEGENLSASVISKVLDVYVGKHPEALNESFGKVYSDAMSESFPCRK